MLSEAYFVLRTRLPELRKLGPLFEAEPWHMAGKTAVRYGSDGSKLLVYAIENGIEVCVVAPDGVSRTYS